jgi:hypothetical protein
VLCRKGNCCCCMLKGWPAGTRPAGIAKVCLRFDAYCSTTIERSILLLGCGSLHKIRGTLQQYRRVSACSITEQADDACNSIKA